MRARGRVAQPLTIFLVEATTDRLAGTVVRWGGRAREVIYDSAAGPPVLPPGGPHKLIAEQMLDV
ncbi:hypothetical protein [Limnoglobus roseus]|uniref:Uncharacterized protein n=1 Tax=Limnoglobus roseus TaxID=2598579 RepID=A0A5C1AND4_9BACT|nr:hypothetical protein [Limnoglobus roseus]QEL20919.1 hypothetical protein PX52LOC_08042 [Limnoglobus roseus]